MVEKEILNLFIYKFKWEKIGNKFLIRKISIIMQMIKKFSANRSILLKRDKAVRKRT